MKALTFNFNVFEITPVLYHNDADIIDEARRMTGLPLSW